MKRYVAAYARRAGIKPRPGITSKARAKLRRAALDNWKASINGRWIEPYVESWNRHREWSHQSIANAVRHIQRGAARGWA